MKMIKQSPIKKFIGLHFGIGCCNLSCDYCYVKNGDGNKIKEIPYTIKEMRRAFSKRRLGGIAFINICSDGETLIHPKMVSIIKMFLEEGHYVMVLTNGTITERIKEVLKIPDDLLKRLFFKISFHYEELMKLNMLKREFDNIKMIKDSPCSLTVEYITSDKTLEYIDEFKANCLNALGTLPQLNIPRDERRHNFGLYSQYSLDNYKQKWEEQGFNSEFFRYRLQVFGKKYKGYCYTGYRQIWVDMTDGSYRQCYHTPKIQGFMKWWHRIKWIPVGECCPEAHCYVMHSHMSLGIVPYEDYMEYFPTYADIRNRVCADGSEWIKPTYKEAFTQGVEQKSISNIWKKIYSIENRIMLWAGRC